MRQQHKWTCLLATLLVACASALAQVAGDAETLVRSVSNDLLESIKSDRQFQSGELVRLKALVDRLVMPHVDMERLTSLAMGPSWKEATATQRERLQQEFKLLLVRSYAGALSQVSSGQTVETRPARGSAADDEQVVSTVVKGQGEPIPIQYRLHRAGSGWKITTSASPASGSPRTIATASPRRSPRPASTG